MGKIFITPKEEIMSAITLPLTALSMAAKANPVIGGAMVGAEVISIASTVMVTGIKTLYGISKGINDFIDEHIEQMKLSENLTVSQSGRVLEMAKFGFGIGYITPVVVIATGQLILGNSLSAITTVATAATLSNPIAMTCAAVGAIYYGWSALSDQEKNELIEKLSKGLEIGRELIKAMISFVIDKTQELLDKSMNLLRDLKNYTGSAAVVFGKKLYDVTGKVKDIIVRVPNIFNVPQKKSSNETEPVSETAQPTTPKKPSPKKWENPLDLNGDGKIDFEDLTHLMKGRGRKKAEQQ